MGKYIVPTNDADLPETSTRRAPSRELRGLPALDALTGFFRRNVSPQTPRRRRRWRAATVFALAVLAIAVAARLFAFDIRRIPTASMEPTLAGGPTSGDRVLVDRLTLLRRPPHRFEIVAFQRPGDRDRELVKRVVGLPGERIRIVDGDLQVNGRLLRKGGPDRKYTLVPLLRSTKHAVLDGFEFDASRVTERADRTIVIRATDLPERGPAGSVAVRSLLLTDGFEADDGSFHPGAQPARDLEVRCTAKLLSPSGTLYVDLREEGDVFLVDVSRGAEDAPTQIRVRRLSPVAADATTIATQVLFDGPGPVWRRDRAMTVALSNVDLRISLEIDGVEPTPPIDLDEITPLQRPSGELFAEPMSRVRVGAFGSDVELQSIEIDRDLRYSPQGRFGIKEAFELGPDEFFVLGDRSTDSDDSRDFGAVPADHLLGVVRAIVSPFARRRWFP